MPEPENAGSCNFCGKPGFRVGWGNDFLCPACARISNVTGDQIMATVRPREWNGPVPWITVFALGAGMNIKSFMRDVVAEIARR